MKLHQLLGMSRAADNDNGEVIGFPLFQSQDGVIRVDHQRMTVVISFNGDEEVIRCGNEVEFQMELNRARSLAAYFSN